MNGARLKQLRLALGITARQMGDLIGLSQTSVYRWEERPANEMSPNEHQERILALIEARASAPTLRQLGDLVRTRGGLYGQYALLQSEFGNLPRGHALPPLPAAPRVAS
jgi:transcriptional regulator with XRE-family HTH domain